MTLYQREGNDIDIGLVGYWKLDDLKGDPDNTTVIDYANFNDGTIDGNPTLDTGPREITYSLNFDGTGDFVNIDDTLTNELATTTQGTWTCWVKPVDATPSAAELFINFGDTDGNEVMNLQITSAGLLLAFVRDAGVNQWIVDTDNAVFSDNIWTHAAIVQDGISPIIYVDGVQIAQAFSTDTDTTKWFNDITDLDNGRIGTRNFNGGGNTLEFNGNIANVRLYNRALNQQEISKLHRLRL